MKEKYKKEKISHTQLILSDYNAIASEFSRVVGLIEVNITTALNRIEEIEKEKSYKVSLTGWIIKCLSKAVSENMELNSYKKGRNRVTFEDIDISLIIEVTTKEGRKVPYNYVVRETQNKSVKEITDEIRALQNKNIDEKEQITRENTKFSSWYVFIPKKIRQFVIRRILKNPFSLKKIIGTVGVTSLGMFAQNIGGWAIPFADKTLNIAVGGIKNGVEVVDGKIKETKMIGLTMMIDHDIVNGGPATRFVACFAELLQNAYNLENIEERN